MAVRRERVELDLVDNLTPGLARAAVAAGLLDRELKGLGGTSVKAGRDLDKPAASAKTLGDNSSKAGPEIDRLSGRLRLLTDAAVILGPSLVPLGAAAVGGVVALSAALGSLAGGIGVTVLATKGLGDGLKALDQYQLEPTAENLKKLQEEMEKLGPAGESFVRFLDSIEPELKSLQSAAREGLLPGAQEGIEALMQRLPELRDLIGGLASEMGDLSADAGKALGGERFDAFFEYLRTDGIKILDDTGRTIGALTETVANLFVAFGGVSTDFSGGLLKFSEGLAEASSHLESNTGFLKFVDYIQTEGPHALETLGSLGNALLQIVEATAPLGGPVLSAVGKFADAIAKIADSDIGTPIFAGLAALALLNRSMAVTASLQKATFGGPAVAGMRSYVTGLGAVVTAQERAQMSAAELDAANAKTGRSLGKFALPAAGLAASMSGLADNVGLSNTAMLSMAGPWGAAAGFALDLWNATDNVTASIDGLNAAMASGDLSALTTEITTAQAKLKELDEDRQGLSFKESLLGPLAGLTHTEQVFSDATGKTGDLKDVLAEAAAKAQELADAENDVASGARTSAGGLSSLVEVTDGITEAILRDTEALRDNVDAMREKRSEALRAANAELNYQAAIDDARKSLKENGKTVDDTTDKGRANLRSLYALADGWNQQSDAAKNAQGSLKAARANFIQTAEAMGASAAQAKRLADRLFEIKPKKVSVDVNVNGQGDVDRLNAALSRAVSKTITLTVNRAGAALGSLHFADGGYTGPGGKHEPAGIVHRGEVVIPQNLVRRDWSMLRQRYGNLPGFADGGLAGSTYTKRQGGDADVWHEVASAAHGAASGLKGLKKQLEAQQKAYDKAKSARDEAVSRRDSLSGTIQQNLMGDSIWGASEGSVWAAGGHGANTPQGAIAALNARTDRARRFIAALNTLKEKGVTGAALQEILSEGLEATEAMAAADLGTLSQFASALNESNSALAAAGLAGGNAVEGDNIRELSATAKAELAELREIKQAIKDADGNNQTAAQGIGFHVVAGVNGGARRGHRRGR